MTFDSERGTGGLPEAKRHPPSAGVPLSVEGNGVERGLGGLPRVHPSSGVALSTEEERRWRIYWQRLEHLARVKRDVEQIVSTPLPLSWVKRDLEGMLRPLPTPRQPPADWVWHDCRQ